MEGLRNFIEVDNHSALDVGDSKKGTRSFEVTKVKVRRGGPRGVNQGRSRGIDAQNCALRNRVSMLITLRRTDGDHLWLMLIGTPFARRSKKVLKVETGTNCTITTKKRVGQPV